MAVERVLGTENDPDIIEFGSEMEITPEQTREEQISEAANILVSEEGIFTEEELNEEMNQPEEAEDFYANIAENLDSSDLSRLSSDLIDSIQGDLESRSEWEKTYTDGLQYLGMKFDESRSQPFQGSSGVVHPILAEAVTQFHIRNCYQLKDQLRLRLLGCELLKQKAKLIAFKNL